MMIKAEYVNPFLEAAALVFKDMLGVELLRGKTVIKDSPDPTNEIAIILGITGNVTGQVVYSMNMETAVKIVQKLMPGVEENVILNEYKDVMGEVGNMITGNAINIFLKNNADLDVTVPQVVDMRAGAPLNLKKNTTIGLNLYSSYGMLEVNIAIN